MVFADFIIVCFSTIVPHLALPVRLRIERTTTAASTPVFDKACHFRANFTSNFSVDQHITCGCSLIFLSSIFFYCRPSIICMCCRKRATNQFKKGRQPGRHTCHGRLLNCWSTKHSLLTVLLSASHYFHVWLCGGSV